MAADATDMRYRYSESIGRSVEVAVAASTSTPVSADEALEPGRYMLRILAFGGAALWVAFGVHGEVAAAAASPAMRFLAHTQAHELNKPVMFFIVKAGDNVPNQLAFFADGGTGATVSVTKVSRDKQ